MLREFFICFPGFLLFIMDSASCQEPCAAGSSYPEVIISPWSNFQKSISDLDIDGRGDSVASVSEFGNLASISCHLLGPCGNRVSEPLTVFRERVAGGGGIVAKDNDGDFFFAWVKEACVRAQAFNRIGEPLGEVRFLSPGNNCLRPVFGEQGPARMTSDGYGHYLVAWNLGDMNGPDPGTIYGTRVRQYDRSGVWLGLEFSIDNTKYYEEIQQNGTAPVIGLASRNGITVLVTLGLSPDRGFLSYTVWILDENLTLRRPPFFATTRGTWPTDGWSPEAVAMSSSGDFTVVWQYPYPSG